MASSSWCLSAAAAALQNITKQATTLTGAQWGQRILEGAYTQTRDATGNPEDPIPWGPGHFFTPRFPEEYNLALPNSSRSQKNVYSIYFQIHMNFVPLTSILNFDT